MTILSTSLAISTALAFTKGLAASLVAVTFGWVPSEQAAEGAAADGYDYLVKLSSEDLEALRDGRAPSLVSELPTDIGPIQRVRFYVGEGDAPRRLNERDLASPQRIAAASALSKTQTVAKPVIPEWKDTAELTADRGRSSSDGPNTTAERRTAFQNPTSLQQGFEEATRPLTDSAQWVESKTRSLLEQSGDSLRRGTENLLRGTGDTLEKIADPYAGRPAQYDNNGYPLQPRVDPPAASTAPQQAQYQQGNPSQITPPPYDYRSAPPTPNYDAPRSGGLPSAGLVEPYASETDPYAATTRGQATQLEPLPRSSGATAPDYRTNPNSADNRATAATQSDPWATPYDRADPYAARREPVSDPLSPPAFPELPASQNSGSAWNSGAAPSNPPPVGGGFASDRAPTSSTAGATPGTGWGGGAAGAPAAGGAGAAASNAAAVETAETRYFEKLLTVILGGVTVFTWIAYLDVRNKYRSVLRNVPGGAYSSAA
ncbi:hypothetical protein Pla108_00830 [Botrimarina colliarenosi]|uniref:Uncharacterized protein n=1 Tax=Botrimarina colliarenosi TaxID=2528001 RepID=A0A5C6AHN9_9BACT|nr:hypothetical protein [Botrimarina colliarenosi]TWT99149.1 hypothetical protein Pla108_00830 [Botrimarina colliarenosi]